MIEEASQSGTPEKSEAPSEGSPQGQTPVDQTASEARPGPDESWAIRGSAAPLAQDPEEASLVLRIGVAINALRAAQHWHIAAQSKPGPSGDRDCTWAFLVAIGFVKEAIQSILKPHYKRIAELARAGGATVDQIRALGKLTSTKPQSLYMRVLEKARNELVFHWDASRFIEWARAYGAPTITWVRGRGFTVGEMVITAADDAAVQLIMPGADQAAIVGMTLEVADAAGLLSDVFEHALIGYFNAKGALLGPDRATTQAPTP